MTFELPEDIRIIQDTVRRFMQNEVLPVDAKVDHDACKVDDDDLARLRSFARDRGLWCILTPGEYGGAGLSVLGQAVVMEEASKCRMGGYIPACGAFGTDPPNVVFMGSEAQIEKFAKPVIETGDPTFVAITEPSGGSDPGRAIQTKAVRDGDDYILNGSKTWITSVEGAPWGVVYVRTGPGEGRDGISCFIVETDRPGFSSRPIEVIRSYSPHEIVFENCRVPVANRIGGEGEGFKFAAAWLVHGRIPYAATTIGMAQAALDIAVKWACDRVAFKSPLADKQAIQWMLADSEVELRAARLLTYQAAARADAGEDVKTDASVCKLYASETAFRVVDRCIQILGGMGVACEMPLERWFRELRIMRIGEGPSEVHRMVIARELLGPHRGRV